MAYDVRELSVKIAGDVTDYLKATDQVQNKTEQTKSSLDKFADGSKKAAIALGTAGAGLTVYAKSATDYTVEQVKNTKELSRQTGMTIEQTSELLAVSKRLGISADQAKQTFGVFSKQIQSATEDIKDAGQKQAELQNKIDVTKFKIKEVTDEINKNGDKTGELNLKVRALNTTLSGLEGELSKSQNAFQKMGIAVTDAQGNQRPFNDLILETADKFKAMRDGSEKTALALELFGRSGKSLIPLLNQGSSGIEELEKKASELGLTLNAKSIVAVEKYIRSQKDLAESSNALKMQVGTLTAPVLTAFNQKVNDVVRSLISADNPLHTLTIDILAFGGPIMGASAALLGFASNLATTVEALGGVRASMMALAAFVTGPWALGFAAAGIALATVSFALFDQKTKSEMLSAAQQKLKTDTDNLRMAQDALARADLNAQSAKLAVEQAQLSYNQAVAQFGPNSFEARQALNNLQQAELSLKDAQDQAKSSLENFHAKQKEVAADKSLINHIRETKSALDVVNGTVVDVGENLKRINGAQVKINSSKKGAVESVQDFNIQTILPHNAKGTDFWQGGPTWVGEEGPEIVNLPRGSSVVPAKQSAQMAASRGGDVNITLNVGMYAGMPVEKRTIALELYKELLRADRAHGGNSLPLLPAVGIQ